MSEFRDDSVLPVRPQDPYLPKARETLEGFFEEHKDEVFFSRQLEVRFESEFYHWITNRALRDLVEQGLLRRERRELLTEGIVDLVWHRRNRYHRRAAAKVVALVSEYAAPALGVALGLHGELMVLEGFATNQFTMRGREANEYGNQKWTTTNHDLDFIFERDGIAYGVEVKNTLGYMDHDELSTKVMMCKHLGLRPVMVCRMLPKAWIYEVAAAGGFALILKYQMYHWTHRELARRVKEELGLPVDSPRRLADATMARFVRWHGRDV